MEYYFHLAESIRNELKHPYVGTEHLFLAYLKKNPIIDYNYFLHCIIDIIGVGSKVSDYVLYTPLLRSLQSKYHTINDCILDILYNSDSIAHNILLSKKIDIDNLYFLVLNS